MKKYFLFVTFLICNFSLNAQVQEPTPSQTQDLPDTVWTKNIWPENVTGVMFSQDGNQVYVSTDKRVWIVNTLTGDSIRTIYGTGIFRYYSPDNKYIYTSGFMKLDANTFKVLDTLKNKKYFDYQYHDMALSPDGKTLICVGFISKFMTKMNYSILKINTETMEVDEYIDYPGAMNHVAASPDGKYFVTDWDNGIFMSKDKTQKLLLWDAKINKVIKEIYRDTSSSFIGFMKFSQDNRYLCTNIRGVLKFYETNNFTKYNSFDDISLGDKGTFDITNDSKFSISSNLEFISVSDLNKKYNGIIYNYPYSGEIIKLSPNQKYFIASNMGLILFNLKYNILDKIENNLDNLNILSINPNPTFQHININFKNIISERYSIFIYNDISKEVYNIYSGYIEVGEHNYISNIQSFANGTYFCKVISNNLNLVQKFIINR